MDDKTTNWLEVSQCSEMCMQSWVLGPNEALCMSRKERKTYHLGGKGMGRWACLFIYLLDHMAYGILVPWQGIEIQAPAVKVPSPNPWITRELPRRPYLAPTANTQGLQLLGYQWPSVPRRMTLPCPQNSSFSSPFHSNNRGILLLKKPHRFLR